VQPRGHRVVQPHAQHLQLVAAAAAQQRRVLGAQRQRALRLRRGARVSYCAQTPFVVAGTIRDNVLFGAPYDAASYEQALRCACLGPDLAALPLGDATRVGENGVTLSGGQRQRLALARAAYRADADVVLLDDPLSALDASVGRAVFDALLGPRGVLARRGAARVLVTHGAQYLPEAHRLLLLRGGGVAMEADYATMAAGGAASPLAELMQLYGEEFAAEPAPGDGIAAPASLGIPVTHRDCSRGVTLVTGHTSRENANGKGPNWEALAQSGTTLVIYMGMAHLAEIAAALRAAGMHGDTPVALIQNGTLATERSVVTSLSSASEAARTSGIRSPAIIVVGDVVRFATQAVAQASEAPRQVAQG
jgi:ABC-type iron transport system FetAB ATPase subunit